MSTDVDVPFSDIWDNLDAGVLASFEASRGKLSLVSNLVYLKLSPDAERPVSPLLPVAPAGAFTVRSVTQQGTSSCARPVGGLRAGRRHAPRARPRRRRARRLARSPPREAPARCTARALLAALRREPRLGRFRGRRARAGPARREGRAHRVGDYGGFDIGGSSHRTGSAAGFFSYRLGEHWDLTLGWRTLEFERERAHLEMAGPLVGAMYRF